MEADRVMVGTVPVYVYLRPDGSVEKVIVWDESLTIHSLHKYNPDTGDDAGERIDGLDEAHAKAYAGDMWPAWDFGA